MQLKIEIRPLTTDSNPEELSRELDAACKKFRFDFGIEEQLLIAGLQHKADQETTKTMRVWLDGSELDYSISAASDVWFSSQSLVPERLLKESEVAERLNQAINGRAVCLFFAILLQEILKQNIELLNDKFDLIESQVEDPWIKIRLSRSYFDSLIENWSESTTAVYKSHDEDLFFLTGIDFPDPEIFFDDSLGDRQFQIQLNNWRSIVFTGISPSQHLVPLDPSFQDNAMLVYNPVENIQMRLAEKTSVDELFGTGLSAFEYILLQLRETLRNKAASFITMSTTREFLKRLSKNFPDLVEAVKLKRSESFITSFLKCIVKDGIPLQQALSIFQSILDYDILPIDGTSLIAFDNRITGKNLTEKSLDDPQLNAEYARLQLRQYISNHLTRGKSALECYLLDNQIEKAIVDRKLSEPGQLINKIEEEITSNYFSTGKMLPLLVTTDTRATLRKLTGKRLPTLDIISFQELSSELNVQVISRITLES